MIKTLIKIKEEKENLLLFSSEGMLLVLNKFEKEIFYKFYKNKFAPLEHLDFFEKLVGYGFLEFENISSKKVSKEYDLSLRNHNSSSPLYPAPVLAHLSVTDRCNMRCKYCSVRDIHSKICQNNLSTEQWKKIIKSLADFGVFQIGFTGGEPTLREDLVELAKCVVDNGCVFNLTTNGWLLDETLVEELVRVGMKQCQVSLDSHLPFVHDKLRGEGSYARVLRAIEILKNKGVVVGIDCVVSNNNLDTILDFIRWVVKNEIPYLTLIKLKKGDLSFEDYSKLAVNYEDYLPILREVCLRESNSNPNITLDCGSVSNLQGVVSKKSFEGVPVAGCPLGHHLICIAPNGDIFACAALLDKRFCLGNILEEDIRDIWVDSPILKKMRLIKKIVLGKCKDCERIDLCRGGCRGIVFSEIGDLVSSDPTCKFLEVKNGSKSR